MPLHQDRRQHRSRRPNQLWSLPATIILLLDRTIAAQPALLERQYIPGVELRDEQTPEELERDRRMREGDGAFFAEKSCFVCHSIEAFDLESPTNKGPDLSWAPDDVRTRFNKTVEEFLFEPTGTMEIILGSQIVLTDEEKWQAVEKITKAYDIVKNRENQEP